MGGRESPTAGHAAVPASAVASYNAIARLLDGGDGVASRTTGQSLMRSARRPTLALAAAVQDGRAASPRNMYRSHPDDVGVGNEDGGVYSPTDAYRRTVMGGGLPPPPEPASSSVPSYTYDSYAAASSPTSAATGAQSSMQHTARKQQYVRKLVKRALRKQRGSSHSLVGEWGSHGEY